MEPPDLNVGAGAAFDAADYRASRRNGNFQIRKKVPAATMVTARETAAVRPGVQSLSRRVWLRTGIASPPSDTVLTKQRRMLALCATHSRVTAGEHGIQIPSTR